MLPCGKVSKRANGIEEGTSLDIFLLMDSLNTVYTSFSGRYIGFK
jgi:hypothetical protein